MNINPCKSKGGIIMTPPGKNLRDSFVCNLFRTPFSEKKVEWTKKILPSKKIWKKIYGGVPRITELGQNLKKKLKTITKNINLKVDSECLDIYLTPCKKAKRSEIYFSCYRRQKLFLPISRPQRTLTIFYSFFTVQKLSSNIYYSKGI